MVEGIIGEMVPFGFMLMVVAIFVGPMWIRNYYAARDRAQIHETLRVAYEKGQPVPPELIERLQARIDSGPRRSYTSSEESDLRRAVVMIAVGLGLCGLGYGLWFGLMSVNDIAAYVTGSIVAGAGSIPGFIGVAYLLLWLTKRNVPKA